MISRGCPSAFPYSFASLKTFALIHVPLLVVACMLSTNARADDPAKELKDVPSLKLAKPARSGRPEIHRIETKTAFEKLGGKDDFAFDFDSHDLLIVRGSMTCANGKVHFQMENMTATFSVEITDRCVHRTRQLHHFAYASAFAFDKDEPIAESVFVTEEGVPARRGNKGELLSKTKATHLNLSSLKVTDADLVKLKAFDNLTHLHLNNNQITDKGLKNLSHLTGLGQIYLGNNSGVTDSGLKHLKGIMTGRIQILGIEGTTITSDGLAQLQEWSTLQKNKFSTQINHSIVTPKIYE